MVNRHIKNGNAVMFRECKSKHKDTIHNSGNGTSLKVWKHQCWWVSGEKGVHIHCCWGCSSLWKAILRALQKLVIELPYKSIDITAWHLSPNMKTFIHKDKCTPMFITAKI